MKRYVLLLLTVCIFAASSQYVFADQSENEFEFEKIVPVPEHAACKKEPTILKKLFKIFIEPHYAEIFAAGYTLSLTGCFFVLLEKRRKKEERYEEIRRKKDQFNIRRQNEIDKACGIDDFDIKFYDKLRRLPEMDRGAYHWKRSWIRIIRNFESDSQHVEKYLLICKKRCEENRDEDGLALVNYRLGVLQQIHAQYEQADALDEQIELQRKDLQARGQVLQEIDWANLEIVS